MKNLTEGNIYKTFILFAIPLILSAILSQAYNTIDAIIAGKFLGADGLAATGATSSYIEFISFGFFGFVSGFSIYIAMLFGAQDYYRLKVTLISNLALVCSISILISILSVIFKDTIFDFLCIDPSIREDASIYFVIMILGMVFTILNVFGLFTINALGMSEFPFRMSIISTVINITGNLLSVTVFNLGVMGLALSSIFSCLVVNIFYFIKIKKCFDEMPSHSIGFVFSPASIKRSISFSLPTAFQQMMMYTSSLLLSPIVNGIGSSATAAYSVVLKIYNINAGVYQNSSKSLSNYTAQCVGAGKYKLIKKGLFVGLVQGVLFVLPFLVVCVAFSDIICKAFFPGDYSGDALSFAVVFVKFFLPFVLFNLLNNLFHAFFRSLKCMGILIISTVVGSISRIIASIILSKYYGIYGIWAGWAISWIVEAIFAFVIYASGVWKKSLKRNISLPNGKEIEL